jgi:hypothetical protein
MRWAGHVTGIGRRGFEKTEGNNLQEDIDVDGRII